MSYILITGSEEYRFYEIENRSLIFEPSADGQFAVQYNLFSARPGQQYYPNLICDAPFSSSNQIQIEKDIHIFDDDTAADLFILSLGEDNIHTKIETTTTVGSVITTRTEVHIINLSKFKIEFNLAGQDIEKGFITRIYQSGSFINGDNLKELSDEVITDIDGNLISDTYLKYFMLTSDK